MQGFVDESKAKTYRMVLVAIENENVNKIRRELRKVQTPTKSPVHFQADDDRIKDSFLILFLTYSSVPLPLALAQRKLLMLASVVLNRS